MRVSWMLFALILASPTRPPVEMPETDDPLLGKGPWLSAKEQVRIRGLWPADVDWVPGLKFYKPTEYSQRISITNNRDQIVAVHKDQDDRWDSPRLEIVLNPNRNERWAAPGGLHGLTGWRSYVGVSLPPGGKIKAWTGRVVTPGSGSGGLAKRLWEFPDGVKFVDLLVANGGAVFELRLREKRNAKWMSNVLLRSHDAFPSGYFGPGRSCASCHDDPGDAYGISKRGGDTVISFPVLVEGTTDFDRRHLPLEEK